MPKQEDLCRHIPSPNAIRFRLSDIEKEAEKLRRLLEISEYIHGTRQTFRGAGK